MSSTAQPIALPDNEPVYRRNFSLFLLDGILFIIAINMIGATTVIPDFVRRLTDSEILIGLSGNLFDIGWALPQLFVARYIVRFERKKWWFAGPNIVVRFLLIVFAGLVVLIGADQPQLLLAAFLFIYASAAVGDGLVHVAWTDLMATSINNHWRARAFGLMTGISGLIMLVIVSPLIGAILSSPHLEFPNNFALLFGLSGMIFALSILPPLFLKELPGGKAVEKVVTLGEFLPYLGTVLRDDFQFRIMIITRMLTILFAMASPFYIGFATITLGLSSTVAIPNMIAMQTLGGIGGAFLYTWLGAKNNLLYIRLALAGGVLLPVSALLSTVVGPVPLYLGFVMSGLGLTNLGLGIQNWIIMHATPEQRPVYAGLYSTLIAVISLLTPFIGGTIAQTIGYEALFVVALVMILAALFVSIRYLRNPVQNSAELVIVVNPAAAD